MHRRRDINDLGRLRHEKARLDHKGQDTVKSEARKRFPFVFRIFWYQLEVCGVIYAAFNYIFSKTPKNIITSAPARRRPLRLNRGSKFAEKIGKKKEPDRDLNPLKMESASRLQEIHRY